MFERGSLLEPRRLEIFEQTFPAAFTAVAAFPVAPKATGGVEEISAVNPDHAGFQLSGDMQRDVDAFAPNTGGQAVDRVVSELNGFPRRAEGHCRQHGTKNLLL